MNTFQLATSSLLLLPLFFSFASLAQTVSLSDAELFSWAERSLPAAFPAGPSNQSISGFTVRSYPTGNHLGIANNRIYALGAITNQQLIDLGLTSNFTCVVNPQSTGCSASTSSPVDEYIGQWNFPCAQYGTGAYTVQSLAYGKMSSSTLVLSLNIKDYGNNSGCTGTPTRTTTYGGQATYQGSKTVNGQTVAKFQVNINDNTFTALGAVVDGKLFRSQGSNEIAVDADGYPGQLRPEAGVK